MGQSRPTADAPGGLSSTDDRRLSGIEAGIRLLSLLKPFAWAIGGAGVLGFLTVAGNTGLLACGALLLSQAALQPPLYQVSLLIVGVRFFGIFRAVMRYVERYVTHNITFRIIGPLRVWFYRALEPLAPARLGNRRSGDLLSRIVNDVEDLKDFYNRGLAPLLVAILVGLAGALFLAFFDLRLALAFGFFYLAAGGGIPWLVGRLSREPSRLLLQARSRLQVSLVETFQGMTEVLVFGQEERQKGEVTALSRKLMGLQDRMAAVNGLSSALSGLTMHLALWTVLVLAIPLVRQGNMEGIYLAMVVLVALSAFEAIPPMTAGLHHWKQSLEGIRRLWAVVESPPVLAEPSVPAPSPRDFSLEGRGLGFRYAPEEPWALKDVDFTLEAGKKLAVVGPSGAGKSTLAHLLVRFWDYQEGSLRLGGRELREYASADIRRWIGLVSQHTYLFSATIRENLLVARPEASEEELMQAVREARLDHFIAGLPQGLDTFLGEGGFKLSGGQRQRLAIARALLKQAPILILDEATTGLDPLTEAEVLEAVYQAMEGRTTLVITHRLAGLDKMDTILVLEGGRVVEKGSWPELTERKGLFYKMWQMERPSGKPQGFDKSRETDKDVE